MVTHALQTAIIWVDARLPAQRDVLFSLKTAFAGLLALYIAFQLQMEDPKWAMMTAYIVSQPLAGMVLSKGFYRILGTLTGSSVALVLVALFAQTPELFICGAALWLGVCAAGATLRRNNQSYGFVLAGYTAVIVGFPGAQTPDAAFDLAVARGSEIILGILVAAAVSQLIFPQYVGSALPARLRSALSGVTGYAASVLGRASVLRGDGGLPAKNIRRRLIADVLALENLHALSAFEAPELRRKAPHIWHFSGTLLSVLSSVLTVHDHLDRLRADHADRLLTALTPVLRSVTAALRRLGGDSWTLADATSLDSELEAAASLVAERLKTAAAVEQQVTQDDAVFYAIVLNRLATLLEDVRGCVATYAVIMAPYTPKSDTGLLRAGPAPHVDFRRAVVNGLRSAIALLLIATLWIVTAWPSGLSAVVIVAVMCSLFASRDQPMAVSRQFMDGALLSSVASFVCGFLILPQLSGFPLLALALFPFLFVMGLAMVNPRTASRGSSFAIFFISLLGPANAMAYDYTAYANGVLALATGMVIAIAVYAVVFPTDRRRLANRLMDGMLDDLRRIGTDRTPPHRQRYEHRMYDRINLLVTTGAAPSHVGRLLRRGLAVLTVGIEMLRLRTLLPDLTESAAAAVTTLLTGLTAQCAATPGIGPASVIATARDTEQRLFALLQGEGGHTTAQAMASVRLITETLAAMPKTFTRRSVR